MARRFTTMDPAPPGVDAVINANGTVFRRVGGIHWTADGVEGAVPMYWPALQAHPDNRVLWEYDPGQAGYVTRDGKRISPLLPDEDTAYQWLLNHQSQSTGWAMRHEGYAIVKAAEAPEVPGEAGQ